MGKKRRYRRNPQKFGKKYGLKYGLNKTVVEAPQQQNITLAAAEPAIETPATTIVAEPVIEKVVIKEDPVAKAVRKTTNKKSASKRTKVSKGNTKTSTTTRNTKRKRSVAAKTTS